MDEILALIKNAEVMRFGSIVAIILFANYKRVWVWGSEYEALKAQRDQERADYAKTISEANATIEKWQNRTLTLAGLADQAIGIRKAQVP